MSGYLIWSNEHRAWWGKNSQGYVRSVLKAGMYSRDEAIDICKNALSGSGDIPNELPVSLADADDFGLGAKIWGTGGQP
jgi:hypothetical protein